RRDGLRRAGGPQRRRGLPRRRRAHRRPGRRDNARRVAGAARPGRAARRGARPGLTYPRELETDRLLLTAWSRDDGEALVDINADAEVMRYLRPAGRAESLAQSERFAAHWDEHGYGLWALRRRTGGDLLGFAGL